MIFSKIKKILFPEDFGCVVCGCKGIEYEEHGGAVLCDACVKDFKKINAPRCIKCGRQIGIENSYCKLCAKYEFAFDEASSVYQYSGTIRELVHKFKYGDEPWIAGFAAKELAKLYKEKGWQCDMVTFVPMYKSKENKRGYNQAAELAEKFSKETGIPCIDLLVRTYKTIPQSYLNEEERMQNLQNVIAVKDKYKDKANGASVLVIDDIITTGSSINECAKALKIVGSIKVYGLSFSSVKD